MNRLLFCTLITALALTGLAAVLQVSAHPQAPPVVVSMTPDTGPNDQQTRVAITGQGFVSPSIALLGDDPLLDVTFVDSSKLEARVPFGLETGIYTLTIGGSVTTTLSDAFTVTAGSIGWASAGPYGGRTSALAIHPTATSTVFVAAELAGLFRTTNGGESWELVFQSPLAPGPEVEVWRGGSDVVFFTAQDGLYRSDQGGDLGSWAKVWMPHGENIQPNDFAIAPSDPSTIYCAAGGSLFYSADGGTVWEERGTGLPGEPRHLAIDPDDAGTVYAAFSEQARLFKTEDAGHSWSELSFTMTIEPDHLGTIQSIATDPYREDSLWVGGFNSGFYHSPDGGETFTNVTSFVTVSQQSWFPVIAFDPNADRIYVGSIGASSAVHYSDDAGATWHGLGLNNQGGMDIAVTPGDRDTIYTTWSGVRKSTDRGESWVYLSDGLAALQPWYLAVSPHDSDRLIVTADAEGAFGTHNRGNTWEKYVVGPVWEADHHRAATFDPLSPTVAYLGGGHELFKTTDDGETWAPAPSMPVPDPPGVYRFAQIQHLTHHPLTPSLLYAGVALGPEVAPGEPEIIRDGALYVSQDAAATWRHISTTGAISVVNRVVFAPSDPQMIYLSTGIGDFDVMGNGIWRSRDGGESWEHPAPPEMVGAMVQGLAVHPDNPQTLLASGTSRSYRDLGVLRSTDGGGSWDETTGLTEPPERNVTAIAYDAGDPRIAYAATHGGLRISFDGGLSWRPYPGAVGQVPITAMTVVPSEEGTRLYLGTVGGTIAPEILPLQVGATPEVLTAGVYVGRSRWYMVQLPLVVRR
ncbi:MAG: WD40/YVTN/BNR-like repeat-containing protein [Anaerolineae bacterium]